MSPAANENAAPSPHSGSGATGVLLINLGTPEAPTPKALRRYLREFLSDRRVVELPRVVWWPVLYGLVLPLRPRRSAKLYRSIWRADGSPLLVYSKALAAGLQRHLREETGPQVQVALGMRYGEPAIRGALEQLRQGGCKRILVLPLYPQYAASTTASAFDAVAAGLRRWRRLPALRFVDGYAGFTPWVAALADSVREFQSRRGRPTRLLFSFHGLPRKQVDAGDPYYEQCQLSARLIAERLGLTGDQWGLSFQSRFGPAPWLRPYTLETLKAWAGKGIHHVQVLCPGFAVDCLETLDEIAAQNRDAFLKAGGERLDYIPALNERPLHAAVLAALVRREAGDWLQADPAEEHARAEIYGLS